MYSTKSLRYAFIFQATRLEKDVLRHQSIPFNVSHQSFPWTFISPTANGTKESFGRSIDDASVIDFTSPIFWNRSM